MRVLATLSLEETVIMVGMGYLDAHVNNDGGWALHLAGSTTLFVAALYYIVVSAARGHCEWSFHRDA